MAPRPAKRQRRSTIVLSDDSDAETQKTNLQREITFDGRTSATVSPIKSTKTRIAAKKPAAKSSPISSPEKTRKGSKVKALPIKSTPIQNFFGKANEEQRWRKKSHTPDVEVENNAELSDAIEDDDLSDETLQELGLKTDTAKITLDRRKSAVSSSTASLKSNSNGGSLPSTQRFAKPAVPVRNSKSTATTDQPEVQGHAPWADRYGPTTLDELMVHKKKITDVQSWLQGRTNGRNNQKLLVLKGPAGSGKTTTVSLLAKAMGVQLVSWYNPTVSELGPNNSISAQFDEFLNRGGQFGSLAFAEDARNQSDSHPDTSSQVLVIEEFPAAMTRSSNALQSFRSVILRFLARARPASTMALRGQPSLDDTGPLVIMIISETLLSSSTALSDSFTAHRLLGPEILNHPYVTAMDFNPVAATFMTKALDIVVKKEARDSRRKRTPGPGVIAKLAEIGDIRSAVNSLEFLCLRGGDGSEWSGTVAAKVKRTSKDNAVLTETEKNSLALVSQRESTLDMFHAAGKIVYNKREDPRVLDTRAEPPPKPPDHLMHLYTPKVSQVDIEALLNETGTDIQTFISTIHENYVLSCNGDAFEDSFEGCSEILSISDVLNPESRPNRRGNSPNPNAGIIQSNFHSGSSDTLRQDEISFNVGTRGLLFNLPFPVNRAGASLPGGKRGDVYKMFYPASLRLWKPIEEMQGLLELFVHGDGTSSHVSKDISTAEGTEGGVASWRSRSLAVSASDPKIKREPVDHLMIPSHEDEDEDGPPTNTIHAKDVLTLELLPFMTRIFSARKKDTLTLEKITKFQPTSYLSTGGESLEDDDELASAGGGVGATLSFGRPAGTGSGARDTARSAPKNEDPAAEMEKMYIEEDDIEDD